MPATAPLAPAEPTGVNGADLAAVLGAGAVEEEKQQAAAKDASRLRTARAWLSKVGGRVDSDASPTCLAPLLLLLSH